MNEREKLLKQIREYAFAMLDSSLYLDAYPDNEEALAYYSNYRDLLKQSKKMYEAKYGPLSIAGNNDSDRWQWIDKPWPWEMEGC